jgi:hypothetical protein
VNRVGSGHRRRSGRTIEVTVEPLTELTGRQRRQLDEQVERVGAILKGAPWLTIRSVTVGAHAWDDTDFRRAAVALD